MMYGARQKKKRANDKNRMNYKFSYFMNYLFMNRRFRFHRHRNNENRPISMNEKKKYKKEKQPKCI